MSRKREGERKEGKSRRWVGRGVGFDAIQKIPKQDFWDGALVGAGSLKPKLRPPAAGYKAQLDGVWEAFAKPTGLIHRHTT
jgi:hypothetical protein